MALRRAYGERLQPARLQERQRGRNGLEQQVRLPADHRHECLRSALVRDVHHFDLRHQAEEFGRQVVEAAAAGRRIAEALRRALRQLDQLPDVRRGNRGMNQQQIGAVRNQADRREIPDRIERELRIDADIDGLRSHRAEKQRVAVGRRARGEFRRDVAAGAGAIVDHHLLAPALAQPLAHHARENIGGAARPERDDDADRFRRIVLRDRRRRGDGDESSGGDVVEVHVDAANAGRLTVFRQKTGSCPARSRCPARARSTATFSPR